MKKRLKMQIASIHDLNLQFEELKQTNVSLIKRNEDLMNTAQAEKSERLRLQSKLEALEALN